MKVAICTPVYRDPRYDYTVSLAGLLLQPCAYERTYLSAQGHIHAKARNMLAKQALDGGADWLLWLDADHDFPADTLDRLLSHGLPFVGCNYARRGEPSGPTASKGGELVWTSQEDARAGRVERVDGIGFGACLVHRSVFEAVGSPWFETDAEDYDFCTKAVKAGFPPHVDHGLSWQIGHVRESLVTNLHALMDRARFKLANKL